jgi:hypothetical protein
LDSTFTDRLGALHWLLVGLTCGRKLSDSIAVLYLCLLEWNSTCIGHWNWLYRLHPFHEMEVCLMEVSPSYCKPLIYRSPQMCISIVRDYHTLAYLTLACLYCDSLQHLSYLLHPSARRQRCSILRIRDARASPHCLLG